MFEDFGFRWFMFRGWVRFYVLMALSWDRRFWSWSGPGGRGSRDIVRVYRVSGFTRDAVICRLDVIRAGLSRDQLMRAEFQLVLIPVRRW